MLHADWAKGPLTLHQKTKWPWSYEIRDADGKVVHDEDMSASSTGWKTIEDALTAKGIPNGTCGYTREQWIEGIMNQRKKLMFLAQTEDIQLGH